MSIFLTVIDLVKRNLNLKYFSFYYELMIKIIIISRSGFTYKCVDTNIGDIISNYEWIGTDVNKYFHFSLFIIFHVLLDSHLFQYSNQTINNYVLCKQTIIVLLDGKSFQYIFMLIV